MNIVKSLILFLISIILIACVVFLFVKLSVFTGVQQGLAIAGIAFIGTGAMVCFGLGISYLLGNDDWR